MAAHAPSDSTSTHGTSVAVVAAVLDFLVATVTSLVEDPDSIVAKLVEVVVDV